MNKIEAELTRMDSIPNHLAVSEDESVDEAVPINIRKERKTKAYKEKTSQNIRNIDTYETRTKVNTTKCRPIYELVKMFPEDFIRECKKNQM